jgi:ankyrin repeat protein
LQTTNRIDLELALWRKWHASSVGHLEVVQTLLGTGRVTPGRKDNNMVSPSDVANKAGHHDIVKLFLDYLQGEMYRLEAELNVLK